MNLEKVLAHQFKPIIHPLNERDCMLYAAGIGVGARPEDASDLQFLYEQNLKVFPSFVNVIAHPGGWVQAPELEVDWVKLLHGEQSFEMHQPLQAGKTYVGHFRVTDVLDKGPGKGCLLYMRKELREQESNELVSTVDAVYFLRGDGGSGGTVQNVPAPHALPERAPDGQVLLTTLPQAALIYRLSGDYNPIHADPALARKAGFERPILHGLCSLGVATRAILQAACDDQPERLKSLKLRFSSPVYPGETIATEYWKDGNVVSFRARAVERDVVVLNNGRAEIHPA
ncbi:3-alpha,7-alpha,12-alpha-trihydroxy-5-beta-cholest-24-enoyl-CoA hydratase (plasmid) [Diaphorobacter sp. HDW4B]|uniref:MaoC/PaaZ C-terminal domain-containing protein n=1 Tax=Diaphorobacter sp. HDW4B TaxID=2714925 RepID=UPI00140E1BF7|nr:MaoC/PaaZ C-terminal domain-containing protein [Diaphorobacter sp. HDW4B]QIL74022.1 3-alpha,7-alpha,12-alpha-trihydroxy-5-beta-cholest-24-enoyl-CoA hydratase [Diaphorobacter sp. HDW4B]